MFQVACIISETCMSLTLPHPVFTLTESRTLLSAFELTGELCALT